MVALELWYLLTFSFSVVWCRKPMKFKKMEAFAMEGKIVGGQYGNIKDFPHAVCLNSYCSSQKAAFWVCGSSILNQRILITAAHCVDDCTHHHKIYAKAGSSNVEESRVTRQVVRMKIHKEYDKPSLFYDIALVYLSGDIPLGQSSRRVIIYTSFPSKTDAFVAGWGVINEKKDSTVKMKFVKQTLWSARNCMKYNSLMPGTFCASSGSPKDYPFAGDSGSGLVTKGGQILGLVSYRVDDKPELAYYTNVSFFYYWIHSESKKLYCLG